MQVTRIDLDGTGSPMGLVAKILKAEPGLTIPVPIEELAHQLDIAEISDLSARRIRGRANYNDARSSGFILVNRAARRGRPASLSDTSWATPHDHPQAAGGWISMFQRRHAALDRQGKRRRHSHGGRSQRVRGPDPDAAPLWRAELAEFRDPDLAHMVTLAGLFDVSKEAAARAYAQYNEEPVAVVVAKDGKIDKVYRDIARFPRLCVRAGAPVPANSLLFRAAQQLNHPSAIAEARAEAWLESDSGQASARPL